MIVFGYSYVIKKMHVIVEIHSSQENQKQAFAPWRKSNGGDLNTIQIRYKICILSVG
jgi:hypothetical protein